ncbi:MAG: hypothetical protein WBY53_17045 [Acidobacteriaceae bacterium]
MLASESGSDLASDILRCVRIAVYGCVRKDFGEGCGAGDDYRAAKREGFEGREAEAFVKGWKDKTTSVFVKGAQFVIVHETQISHARAAKVRIFENTVIRPASNDQFGRIGGKMCGCRYDAAEVFVWVPRSNSKAIQSGLEIMFFKYIAIRLAAEYVLSGKPAKGNFLGRNSQAGDELLSGKFRDGNNVRRCEGENLLKELVVISISRGVGGRGFERPGIMNGYYMVAVSQWSSSARCE